MLKNFGENNLNAHKNGQIAFSWNESADQKFAAQSSLLTLKIKARKSGLLSEFVQLNSALTMATVFDEQGHEQRLSLQFEKTNPTITVDAQPNPFTDVVNVKISQNTEGVVQYSIFDNLGNLVFQNKQNAPKGASILKLNSAAINVVKSGIYFLKLETNEGSKTVKLSKI